MATLIRPVISENSKYYISKHRHYELKHFCLQYPEWKRLYSELDDVTVPLSMMDRLPSSNMPGDPTSERALLKIFYADKIELIEQAAKEADQYLYEYILRAVTEGLSYTLLKTRLGIPCSRDTYYDRYRRFFWLLNESRR